MGFKSFCLLAIPAFFAYAILCLQTVLVCCMHASQIVRSARSLCRKADAVLAEVLQEVISSSGMGVSRRPGNSFCFRFRVVATGRGAFPAYARWHACFCGTLKSAVVCNMSKPFQIQKRLSGILSVASLLLAKLAIVSAYLLYNRWQHWCGSVV